MSDPSDLHVLLLDAFSACIAPKGATYCSAPITSGKRNFEWLRAVGKDFESVDNASDEERSIHAQHVIAANCEHARAVVARLRKERGEVIIDPTAFPAVASWTQQDWLRFWGAVIERYASAVVFINDWQYSNGCAEEFLIAASLRLATFDESGRSLTLTEASELVESAVLETKRFRGPTSSLERTLARMVARMDGEDPQSTAAPLTERANSAL
jgi:hypothetical protein